MRSAPIFGREARALALQGRLILGALARRPRALAGARVAVFVHGYLAAGAVFDPMRAHVEKHLGIATLDFTYGPHLPFSRVVEKLASHVERHAPRGASVSLVGHSLGGIVARTYLHDHGSARVDRIVTLATPHAGTRPARFAPGSQAATVRPDSSVLERLRRDCADTLHIPHIAVVAGQDRMCYPPESAAALEGAVVHRIDDLTHNEMLYDPRILKLVTDALA